MNISIEAQILKQALSQILTVVDKRNPRVILTNCLFKVENNELFIEATDLEVSTRLKINSNINTSGQFCVNPKNLYDLVREMPDKNLEINVNFDTNSMSIICDQINITLLITPSDDFPKLNFTENDFNLEIQSKDFLNIINKTSHAISHDETRIMLNGIFFQHLNGNLRAVATNGYTFALVETEEFRSENQYLENGVIIPKKGITEIKKVLESNLDEIIKINLNDSFIYLNLENMISLSIRLIARDFPPYQTVIPNKTAYSLTVPKDLILNAIKRVKILANEKSNAIKFTIGSHQLTVSANHPSLGEATEKLEINYSDEPIQIGFNAKYMIDSLSVFEDTDEITFEFNNELSPVILKSYNMNQFLGIIMPLKL